MNFVFEKEAADLLLNFTNCTDLNPSGIPRFRVSPLFTEIIQLRADRKIDIKVLTRIPDNEKYIIASGVAHSPDFWTGVFSKTPSGKSVFEFLNKRYLEDLQNQNAFLLLDQSHEGYHELWLNQWFHKECEKFNINPRQIIYVTGNLKCSDQYEKFCDENHIIDKMLVLPYPHFEHAVSQMVSNALPTLKDHLLYKDKSKDKIKLYNCLQKRPRNHRQWLYKDLYEKNLLDLGINSMNSFKQIHSYMSGRTISEELTNTLNKNLPLYPPNDENTSEFESGDCGSYLTNFNNQILLDSWLSIISEASFDDSSYTCFLSEKTFKTIACEHPFIIYGDRNSLYYLKKLGYKTFHPFIDESYDEKSTFDRLDAITNEVVRLSKMTFEEKMIFYYNVSPIIVHNKKILSKRKRNVINVIKQLQEKVS